MLARSSPSSTVLSGKSPPMAEVTPVTVTAEEIAQMEKRKELMLKIKEEHLAALQFEGSIWKELR